ncbi:hypothetical protein JCM15124A_16690 [Prevotella falsenii]
MILNPLAAHAQNEEPIISFHTNMYEKVQGSGVTPSVTFVLGATENKQIVSIDCGAGEEEFEVDVARLDGEQSIKGSVYTGQVSKEGWVKIYGDPTKIDYFNASGNEIDEIKFSSKLNLQILNLEHNILNALNIDDLKNLQVIYLQDNPFTAATPLMIGYLPKLLVLEMPQCGHVSPNFTLRNFPALRSFDAYHSLSLKTADPTACPNLQRLSLDMTGVSSVDLSKNPELQILNVSDSRIKSLDLSNNPKIRELYVSHTSGAVNTDVKFDEIDVSHCPELYYFFCGGNNFKKLDVSKNLKLFTFSCDNNLLRSLDVTNNKDLYSVNVRNNYMDFATLPLPGNWFEYYHEQHEMELNDTYKVGDVIDLTKRVLRQGTTTNGKLYRVPKADPTKPVELDDTYYKYENGKITLLKALTDQVFLQFTNSVLKDYPIRTENFAIRTAEDFGKDIKAVELSSLGSAGAPVKISIGILGATDAAPVTVKVDLGDGNLTPIAIKSDRPTAPNIDTQRKGSGNIVVYVPQDYYVTLLETNDLNIDNIDLTALTQLRVLSLRNAGLRNIDLSYNNKLEKLDLTGNLLSRLTLKGPSSYFYKSQLSDINLSNNQLETFEYDDFYAVRYFDISNNKMTALDVSDADNLRSLNISNNAFTRLLLNHSELLERLNAANNQLVEIAIPPVAPITDLDVSGNNFTLGNMPKDFGLDEAHFIYAPQHTLEISTSSPGIDLSEQFITKNGATTQYVWKKENGEKLKEGTDYTIKDGSTKFVNLSVGKIYCEMTHAAYPAFKGEKVFKTTFVQPIGMPQYELASFTTEVQTDSVELSLASPVKGTSVYFEWNADGNVTQYTLDTTYKRFRAKSKAGAKVRVLVANADEKLSIFSVSGVKMSAADLSGLKDAGTIALADAGLSAVNIPASTALTELNLSGNELTEIDLTKFPNLFFLSLNENKLKSIDLSKAKKLGLAFLSGNRLTDVKIENTGLWNLDLSKNMLESVSLDNAPALEQLWLNDNRLLKVDISKNPKLAVLNVVKNRLRFSTMPIAVDRDGKSLFNKYSYNLQDPLDVKCVNGKVDLSSEAMVDNEPTKYRWFIDHIDVIDGEPQGEELESDEFSIENGVTTLKLTDAANNLVCLMRNTRLPNLYQITNYVSFDPNPTGVDGVGAGEDVKVQLVNGGITVLGAKNSTLVVYTIDGKLAYQSKLADNETRVSLAAGTYIVRVGNKAAKVNVR